MVFTVLMTVGALASAAYAVNTMQPFTDYRWLMLSALALATARLKVKLPGLNGNMSVNLPFLLVAVMQLGILEALLVALPACALQCVPKGGGKPKLIQMVFNLSTTAVAVALACGIVEQFALLAAAGFFLFQTVPVAAIVTLTEGGRMDRVWSSIAHYSFPFYLLSAGIASIALSAPQFGWQMSLASLPVLFAVYRSYESYFRRPESAVWGS
jgi:hypothetical protein